MLLLRYLLIAGGMVCLFAAAAPFAVTFYRRFCSEVLGKPEAQPIDEAALPDIRLAALERSHLYKKCQQLGIDIRELRSRG